MAFSGNKTCFNRTKKKALPVSRLQDLLCHVGVYRCAHICVNTCAFLEHDG